MNRALFIAAALLCFFTNSLTSAKVVDFGEASIIYLNKDKLTLKAAQVLQEEIAKRTALELPIREKPFKKDNALIYLATNKELHKLPKQFQPRIQAMQPTSAEGFKILVDESLQKTILIIGHDQRGLLYGVGYLLRKSEMRSKRFNVWNDLLISSSPHYPLRGHQMGYRPKTNSYDAWSVNQFDQYIRELALFGANSIEIMPPRTDDDWTSVHMKLPAIKMMAEQSRICRDYGLDVWMWYPNMGENYPHPDSLAVELKERHEVFSATPKLDHLFVPGGDPGELEPDVLFSWLEQVSKVLMHYHPQAKIWVSPQVFRPTQEWFDIFFEHVNKKSSWFGGVVFGPWVKMPIQEIRRVLDADIPIRRYPDITHSLSSQYPIPRWDLAYAITLGRECINPRPTQEKTIHNALDEFAIGSLSYSEGTNDDVNKFVWSCQDWDPQMPVIETLRDYAGLFIGPDYAEEVAQGLLALEENIVGPLTANDGVQRTLQQWQRLEEQAPDCILSNYRFQMGLIRAYFDAYVQRRLVFETDLEMQARDILSAAKEIGADKAIKSARSVLAKSSENRVRPEQWQKCYDLADSLFLSIGAQLTVEKHDAMSGRGNFIDNIDMPLNDAVWMLAMLEYAEKLDNEEKKSAAIQSMLSRTDPGPGGFYDNFGSPKSWARVKPGKSWEDDPGNLASPRVSFGVGLRGKEWVHEITAKGFEGGAAPLSWMHQATTLYDEPLVIIYDDLSRNKIYTLRVAYTGRFRSKMKLTADKKFIIHDFMRTGLQPIYEYEIPKEATFDGVLNLEWTCGEGERGSQVSEIWLIPKNE